MCRNMQHLPSSPRIPDLCPNLMHAPLNFAVVFGIFTHNIEATPEGRAKTHKESNKVKQPKKNEKDKLFESSFHTKRECNSKLAHEKLSNIIILFIYLFLEKHQLKTHTSFAHRQTDVHTSPPCT